MVDLPNWVWWLVILSPAIITPPIALVYLRRSGGGKIGFIRSMFVSAPAALPIAVFGWLVSDSFEESDYSTLAFFMFIFPLGWASSFGPWIVELTEQLNQRISRDGPTEDK